MRATKPSLARGVPRAIIEAALAATDSRAFRTMLRPLLRAHVAFDAYCVNTCDPVTRAVTSSVGDGLSPADARKLFAIESAGRDVNLLAHLAPEGPVVATLQTATRGKPRSSRRMREIFAPLGFCDELRAALVLGDRPWGYLHLFRKQIPVRRGGHRTNRVRGARDRSRSREESRDAATSSARAFRARIDRSRSPRQDRPCVGPRARPGRRARLRWASSNPARHRRGAVRSRGGMLSDWGRRLGRVSRV